MFTTPESVRTASLASPERPPCINGCARECADDSECCAACRDEIRAEERAARMVVAREAQAAYLALPLDVTGLNAYLASKRWRDAVDALSEEEHEAFKLEQAPARRGAGMGRATVAA